MTDQRSGLTNPTMRSAAFLALNLLILIGFSWVAFSAHTQELFLGTDGATFISTAYEQLTYFGKSLSLQSNMLQGLNNLSMGINLSFIPAHWFHFFDPAQGHYAPVPLYSFYAVVYFLSVLIMGWNYGFSRRIYYTAAWLMTLLYFPFILYFRVYPITGLIPSVAIVAFTVALFDVAFWRSGRSSYLMDGFYVLLTLFALLILLAISPLSSLLIAPYRMASLICAFIAAETNRQRVRKLAVLGIVFIIILVMGWVEFELGLFLHTAAIFFAGDATTAGKLGLLDVSIIFQGPFQSYGDRTMGTFLFLAASIGAWLTLKRGNVIQRVLAKHVLLWQCFLVVLITLLSRFVAHWVYPIPMVYELVYLPLYALFAAVAFHHVLQRYAGKLDAILTRHTLVPFALLIIPALYLLTVTPPERASWAIPAKDSSLTKPLEEIIGLAPGKPFSGRVVSMIPGKTFEEQEQYFYALGEKIGNEHLSTGLWLHNIPTLVEYNQLMTPYFFWFVQHFLQGGEVEQRRNWINFSVANLPVLRMLGVRYILSPEPIAGANKVMSMQVDGMKSLDLFEVDGPNINGVSASQVVTVKTLAEAEKTIAQHARTPSTAVLFEGQQQDVPSHFASIWRSDITTARGGWHITATSGGTSMLIVPVEFSHCLDLVPGDGIAAPKAVRVNAVLTGLIFEKTLDVTMASSIGMFNKPTCRWQDYKSFNRLVNIK